MPQALQPVTKTFTYVCFLYICFLQFFLMEYNTTRSYLSMREYGRHIQGMVDYVLTIEDRTKRNEQAKAVIE